MTERLANDVARFCSAFIIALLLLAARPQTHGVQLVLLMGAAAAAGATVVVMSRRLHRPEPTPPSPWQPRLCGKRKTRWWPWSVRCAFDALHPGSCSFHVVRDRKAANLALLKADRSTQRIHHDYPYECQNCNERREKIVRYVDDIEISHAGEQFPTSTPIFKGYVCLRCSEVSAEKEPFTTAGSIAWYLERAPTPAPLPRETLLRAIFQVETELIQLRKLLQDATEPYR